MTNLSNSFTLEQLTASTIALKRGISNVPNADQIENLKLLAATLDDVQQLLGSPLYIDSGFRCPKLNSAVGGSASSAHLEGYAADFVCPAFGSPLDICKAIEGSGIHFDQCIQEGTWTHLSVDPRMRQQTLTAHFDNGKASYTTGIS